MRAIKKYGQPLLLVFMIAYITLNLMTLTRFPYIHSDEAWLSGLSRTVMDKETFATSEPFFDLYPRAIHGLRIVFVSLQMLFIQVLGYKISSLRLLSLLFGLGSISVIYWHFKQKALTNNKAIMQTSIVALSCQFILMSHMARQDALILFFMLLAYSLLCQPAFKHQHFFVASLVGISMGIHPNSFLIGLGIGFLYLDGFFTRKYPLKTVALYVLQLAIWACIFVGISFYLNPNFLKDYLAFGQQLGITNHNLSRMAGFYYYYLKLWHQIGGTYVLVPIRVDLSITAIGFIGNLIISIRRCLKPKTSEAIRPKAFWLFIGINCGLFIIGRYNQTAIVFVLVVGWLMFFELLWHLEKINLSLVTPKIIGLVLLCLLLVQGHTTYKTISSFQHQNYNTFGQRITEKIPDDARVLANLNLDYHMNLYQLYDIRNLDHLSDYQLSFEDYIKKNHINYVILYEEMTYIHDAKGKWDILYGDLAYYEDMMAYLAVHGQAIDRIKTPTYGMRIARYVDVYPWEVTIYKLSDNK